MGNKIRVTEKQKEVIRLMLKGWGLCHWNTQCFLYKRGKEKPIHLATYKSLLSKRLIEWSTLGQAQYYRLSNKGASILKH